MKFRPLEDRVIVIPVDAESTTPGGIVLPDAAKEKPQRGTVQSTGPGRFSADGTRIPMGVREGDVVLFHIYGGTDVDVDGKPVKILREADILAVIE